MASAPDRDRTYRAKHSILPDPPAAPSSRVRARVSSAWLPLIVTVFCLLLTARGVQSERAHARHGDQQHFSVLSERLKAEISRRVDVYRVALLGMRSLYAASVHVDRSEFAAAINTRDLVSEFPGALGMGYVNRVARTDVPTFLARTRADGAPDFQLRSRGDHDPLMVIELVEPLAPNKAAQGFDIAQDAHRHAAAERAMRTGHASLTEKLTLVQATRAGPGFLYLLPIYRSGEPVATEHQRTAALQGWVFVTIVAAQVFLGTTETADDELGFAVYDGDKTDSDALIYGDHATYASHVAKHLFASSVQLTIGGRHWTLAMHTTPRFRAAPANAVGFIGGSISLLLGVLLYTQGAAVRRAKARADAMTLDVHRLALVAERSTNGVLITDASRRITWVNEGFTRLSGYSAPELIGKDITHGVDMADMKRTGPLVAHRLVTALIDGHAFRGEVLRRSKNKELRTFDCDVQALRNEHGKLTGFMAVETDITEGTRTKAELQESQGKLQLLLDSAGEAIFGIDTAGCFAFCNPACVRQLGYHSAQELLGKNAHALLHQSHDEELSHLPMLCPIYQVLRGGQGCHVPDDVYHRADGSHFRVSYSLHPQRSGDMVVGAVVAFVDITDRLEREEKLRIAQRRAEDASRSKSEFLANMSHEIRTPMTAILGYAELLSEEGGFASTSHQRLEYCATIKRNGEHLLSIINDILDISKVEAGMLKIERLETSPERIVQDVLGTMGVKAQAKGLSLTYLPHADLPLAIMTDPMRLRQILINLLGNAVKFTEVGGVTLTVARDGTQRLRFDIVDTGIGMTTEQATRVFGKFEQADTSTTRKFGGTGLGLQISKRLAEMLGGDITLVSELGKGSTFSVVIDGGEVEPSIVRSRMPKALLSSVPVPDGANAQPLLGARILLAEDGKDNQRLIAHHLRKAGAEVRIVDNGRAAIETLSADGTLDGQLVASPPVDVILTDMQMPEMDGYLATRILRAKGCNLPIVALTAHTMSGDAEKCLAAGCDGYAAKPIDRRQLIEICARALAGKLRRPAPLPVPAVRP